jgi:hypothetical protein
LVGSDFQFTTKVQLKKMGDEFATLEPVKFLLPNGLGEGPQDHLDVQIDTTNLGPGAYELLIAQQDDKSHPVKFNVLGGAAKVTNFPVQVNQGVATQHFALKGEHLSDLAKLEVSGAKVELGEVNNNGTERNVTIQLESNLAPGTSLPVTEYLQDRAATQTIPAGLQITGPLPLIASSRLSLPAGLTISTKPNEFPVGSTLTAVLDVKNIERRSALRLSCEDASWTGVSLQIGGRSDVSSLQQLSPDQLFLSYSTATLPSGCQLQAVIDNGRDGKSQPFDLAKIILMPEIDSFVSTGPGPDGATTYSITGQSLEMIQRLGWDQANGVDVTNLPNPVPGQGQKQCLSVNLPAVTSNPASLYIWLRGDDSGRSTTIKVPPASPVPAATASTPPTAPATAKTPPGGKQNPPNPGSAPGPPHVL